MMTAWLTSCLNSISGVQELHFDEKCHNAAHRDWFQRDLISATLCLWMRTTSPGLMLKYKQKMECDRKDSFQLLFEDTLLRTTLHGKIWFDDKCHFTKMFYLVKELNEMSRYATKLAHPQQG